MSALEPSIETCENPSSLPVSLSLRLSSAPAAAWLYRLSFGAMNMSSKLPPASTSVCHLPKRSLKGWSTTTSFRPGLAARIESRTLLKAVSSPPPELYDSQMLSVPTRPVGAWLPAAWDAGAWDAGAVVAEPLGPQAATTMATPANRV